MMNKAFWRDVGIRAVRTMAQAAVGGISTAAVMSDVNWIQVLSASILAGLVSVLMSLDRLEIPKQTPVENEGESNDA